MSSPIRNSRHAGEFAPQPYEVSESHLRNEARAAVHDFSIVLGGPVYDFLQRVGLVRLGLPNVFRRIIAVIVITWVPLFLLSIKDGLAIGHRVKIPLLLDYSAYGRLLIGLPLLLLAEVVIDPAIRSAVKEFVDAKLIQEKELPQFEKVLHRAQKLRDSVIPELILLLLAFFPVFVFQHEWQTGAVSSWHSTANGLTAAGWWYAVVSAPFIRFFLYRWAFRYFIWTLLLWKLSRTPLHLNPTHPDRAAGLGFLSITQTRFGVLFCALGCSFAGHIANSVTHEGASLASFKILIAAFAALCVIVGVCPLVLWAPKMARVRRTGLREYAALGNQYTEEFDRKWIHFSERPSEPLLGSGDIQSLADLGNSYQIIEEMSIAPITKGLVIKLAVLAAAPLLPVIVAVTPTSQIVNAILKMIA